MLLVASYLLSFLVISQRIEFEVQDGLVVTVRLGTPAQEIPLKLSLIANETFVRLKTESCEGFNDAQSSTFVSGNQNFSDFLSLPDGSQIKLQDIKILDDCSSNSSFGSLGLNYYPNQVVSSLFSLALIENPQFSLDLNHNNSGVLVFGEIEGNISEQFKVNSSSSMKSWGFPSRGFRFGSAFGTKSFNVVLDASEPFIVAPESIISQVFSSLLQEVSCRVSEFKFIYCPCDTIANSPQLIFYVFDQTVTLSSENLFEVVDEECRFAVTYHSNDTWILGHQFFYEYILTFDLEYKMIDLQLKQKTEEEEEKPILNGDEIWITVFTISGCFLFYVLVRITYVVYGWVSERFGSNNDDIQEPLMENLDFIEIAKFRARRSEMSNR